MYPVIDIQNEAESLEQVGSKHKFWYANHSRMFKLGREGTGEHWAEKLSSELCTLLGIPHATYHLANWKGRLGTTTDNFVPRGGRLILGNERLASFVEGYDGTRTYRARQHTVRRVMAALSHETVLPPDDCPAGLTARDAFAGYILLDAWIGNTDRHHHNWGLIRIGERIHLAPSFDHASSLGRELDDAVKAARLSPQDERRSVSAYVVKARSGLYRTEADQSSLSTLEAFLEVSRFAPAGAAYWSDRLEHVTSCQIDQTVGQMPPEAMSDVSRQFVKELLKQNRERLVDNERIRAG